MVKALRRKVDLSEPTKRMIKALNDFELNASMILTCNDYKLAQNEQLKLVQQRTLTTSRKFLDILIKKKKVYTRKEVNKRYYMKRKKLFQEKKEEKRDITPFFGTFFENLMG